MRTIMTFLEPPPSKPSDDLEGLLRAFFRSQLPKPWPSPRLSLVRVVPLRHAATNRRSLMRSRWALAASVALLLLGSLLLPRRFSQDAKPENRISAPTIGSDDMRRKMDREHKNKSSENKTKPGLSAEDGEQVPEMDDADLPFIK